MSQTMPPPVFDPFAPGFTDDRLDALRERILIGRARGPGELLQEERVPARKVFKQGFAILQGNRTIGTRSRVFPPMPVGVDPRGGWKKNEDPAETQRRSFIATVQSSKQCQPVDRSLPALRRSTRRRPHWF